MRKTALATIASILLYLGVVSAQATCLPQRCLYLPVIVQAGDTSTPTVQVMPTPQITLTPTVLQTVTSTTTAQSTATTQATATTRPTLTQTSTSTTNPNMKVMLLSSNAFVPYTGSNDLYIVGEVQNNTSSNVQFVKVNVVLRDANGSIVDGEYSYSDIDKLKLGMVSPFLVIFSNPPTWLSYEVTLTWSTTTEEPYPLEITNPETYFDSYNAYHIRGSVKNQYSVQRTFVQLFLTLYDPSNQVIGVATTYLNPSTLEPGQEVSFDVEAFFWKYKPDKTKITRYTLQVYDD